MARKLVGHRPVLPGVSRIWDIFLVLGQFYFGGHGNLPKFRGTWGKDLKLWGPINQYSKKKLNCFVEEKNKS